MKTKIFKYILLVFLTQSFLSCEDYLEKYPLDTPSSATFLQTEAEMELAVNGAYERMSVPVFYNLPLEVFLDTYSDIAWDRVSANNQMLGNGNVTPTNGILETIWIYMYQGIERCNFILENSDRVSEINDQAKFDQMLGEAKFIRAYFYSHLTELFGDVPFVTTPLELENSYIGQTNKADIVSAILSDLEDAAGKLPDEYTKSSDAGRATKGAALALKARIALLNEKWDIATDASQRVIQTDKYILDSDYASLYLKSSQDVSKEILYKHNYLDGVRITYAGYYYGTRMGTGASALIPVQSLIDSYLCEDGLTIDKSPLYNPLKPFENRDPRMQKSLILPGSIFQGYEYQTHRDSVKCWNYNVNPPTRVDNQDAISPYASFSGYACRKYADMSNPAYRLRSETGIIVMRYAEVLLTYAEAKIEASQIDQSVYDAINKVRTRAGMPDVSSGKSQDELRAIVRIERKSEFAMEGLRLYDIRRWKIAEDVLKGNLYGRIQRGLLASAPAIDENGTPDYTGVSNASELRIIEVRTFTAPKHYLFPIPQIEMDVNDALEPNPGY